MALGVASEVAQRNEEEDEGRDDGDDADNACRESLKPARLVLERRERRPADRDLSLPVFSPFAHSSHPLRDHPALSRSTHR
ncbi:MAG: hypothetical protein HYY95_16620 [Candidatus Rokubacteria bacterium]|nr:hypothetical protein [Candidatus Rokubacteria bacterium]